MRSALRSGFAWESFPSRPRSARYVKRALPSESACRTSPILPVCCENDGAQNAPRGKWDALISKRRKSWKEESKTGQRAHMKPPADAKWRRFEAHRREEDLDSD